MSGGIPLEDKRKNITLSAIHVFQEKGIEKATVSDIVKKAGVAQGTFYLYFPSKLSVMPAIAEVMVTKTINKLVENVNDKAPFNIKLQEMIETIFAITEQYRDILALIYAGMASSDHLKEWEDIYKPYYSHIATILEEAKQDGTVRQTVHPERIAILLIGLIESAADQSYLYDSQDDEKIELKKKEVYEFAKHALI